MAIIMVIVMLATMVLLVRRRGGARIRWRQMPSLDQRGHFRSFLTSALSVCVFLCETYLFYCYVSTLTPLYVRLQSTTNHELYTYSMTTGTAGTGLPTLGFTQFSGQHTNAVPDSSSLVLDPTMQVRTPHSIFNFQL